MEEVCGEGVEQVGEGVIEKGRSEYDEEYDYDLLREAYNRLLYVLGALPEHCPEHVGEYEYPDEPDCVALDHTVYSLVTLPGHVLPPKTGIRIIYSNAAVSPELIHLKIERKYPAA